MMEFTNGMSDQEVRAKSVLEQLHPAAEPIAPHIAEELWFALGHTTTLASNHGRLPTRSG
ncbi:MAG UNVERIFIED_CONTAM: hypothetical protein LVR18_48515 [Planctomycetaceae bacterium]|jgi:leucyl-tRNA synthetase